MGRWELPGMVPQGPSFMSDCVGGGNGVSSGGDQNVPVSFGQVVHFLVKDFSASEFPGWFLPFLVTSNMLWIQFEGTFPDELE